MRFPTRLIAANVFMALIGYAVLIVAVIGIAVAVAVFGDLSESAWEKGTQAANWFALFVGVGLIHQFLPLYIAHGVGRRDFARHAALTTIVVGPLLAVLVTIGYLVEAGVYRVADVAQELGQDHLFGSPTDVLTVFGEYTVVLLVWMSAGALMGAAFYRWDGAGLLSLPIGIALIAGVELLTGDRMLPILPDPGGASSIPVVLGAGAALYLSGLALTWPMVKDVALHNDKG